MITPRPYQIEAVNSVFDWFKKNATGNPLVGMPTGTGKSIVIAGLIWKKLQIKPAHRFLNLTHDSRLISQNVATLRRLWPMAPIGVHAAKLKAKDTAQQILFGSIQSVHQTFKRKGDVFGNIDTILIDECHLVGSAENSMYLAVLAAIRKANPHVVIVGFTATAYRMKMGLLTDGEIFTDFAYDKTTREDFNEFVRAGYLAPLIPRPTATTIDLSNVKLSKGDFNEKDLQAASNVDRITHGAIREVLQYAADRQHWLVFTSGIEHAESVCQILELHGISADCVHAKRTDHDNAKALAAFRNGEIQAMVNADMLTTGFDSPHIDCIVMLRGTMSPGLHVQMLGRGTRPCEGKKNCLVFDFAGNVARLGPINDPVLPRKPGSGGAAQPAPIKYCPVPGCGVMNHTMARYCIACETEFDFRTTLQSTSGTHEVIAGLEPAKLEMWEVHSVYYRSILSKKVNAAKVKIPMLKVTYLSSGKEASELLCFEHEGAAKHIARGWWKKRAKGLNIPTPDSVGEALQWAKQLPHPKRIQIEHVGQYPKVTNHEF